MNKPTIRFIAKNELNELVQLCAAHAAYEQSIFNEKNKAQNLGKNIFTKNSTLYCLVVKHENKLIGYATYMKQFSTWDACFYIYMDCLYLSEKSRGFGIGEQLINRIKQEAQKLNCSLIQWQTPEFNTGAIKFYKRIGAVSKSKERFFLEV